MLGVVEALTLKELKVRTRRTGVTSPFSDLRAASCRVGCRGRSHHLAKVERLFRSLANYRRVIVTALAQRFTTGDINVTADVRTGLCRKRRAFLRDGERADAIAVEAVDRRAQSFGQSLCAHPLGFSLIPARKGRDFNSASP